MQLLFNKLTENEENQEAVQQMFAGIYGGDILSKSN
jgi:hypothetical protein